MRRKAIEQALSDLRMDVDVLYKREENREAEKEAQRRREWNRAIREIYYKPL